MSDGVTGHGGVFFRARGPDGALERVPAAGAKPAERM